MRKLQPLGWMPTYYAGVHKSWSKLYLSPFLNIKQFIPQRFFLSGQDALWPLKRVANYLFQLSVFGFFEQELGTIAFPVCILLYVLLDSANQCLSGRIVFKNPATIAPCTLDSSFFPVLVAVIARCWSCGGWRGFQHSFACIINFQDWGWVDEDHWIICCWKMWIEIISHCNLNLDFGLARILCNYLATWKNESLKEKQQEEEMKHKKKETGQVCTGEKKKEGWKLHSIQGME